MRSAGAFISLGQADREALFRWLAGPAAGQIDTAIDLTARPWNVGAARAVIGLFEPGRKDASWLVIGCRTGWALADCATGSVRGVRDSLGKALALAVA